MSTKEPHPIDLAIGRAIRMRRKAKGMSQERLGEMLGVTFQQVQKYEKGTNRISGSRLVECARALGCQPKDLQPMLDQNNDPVAPKATDTGLILAELANTTLAALYQYREAEAQAQEIGS